MGVGKITNRIVIWVIANKVFKKKIGNKTYLLKYKEAYIVATSEIDGAHGLPRDIVTFTKELQQVLHDVGQQIIGNSIKPESAQRYSCIVIQRLNRKEEES